MTTDATDLPPAPDGFVPHAFERSWDLQLPRAQVWAWLNDPDTFVRGQPWPYFVEFVGGGFEPGVQNTHSGPFLHCCGEIGEVRAPEYRDLRYHYGAYVLRMRWIRPTRLQFWVDERGGDGGACRVRVRVRIDSHCRRWMRAPWTLVNRCFWGLFGWTMPSQVRRHSRRAAAAAAATTTTAS